MPTRTPISVGLALTTYVPAVEATAKNSPRVSLKTWAVTVAAWAFPSSDDVNLLHSLGSGTDSSVRVSSAAGWEVVPAIGDTGTRTWALASAGEETTAVLLAVKSDNTENPAVLETTTLVNNSLSQTTFTVPKPAGTVAGDLIVVSLVYDESGSERTTTPPAGNWVELYDVSNDSNTSGQSVYRLIAGDSEPAEYDFTISSVEQWIGTALRISGVDQVNPIDVSSLWTASSGDIVLPAVTTTRKNALLIHLIGGDRTEGLKTNQDVWLDRPDNIYVGDLLVAVVSRSRGLGTITPPTGWTLETDIQDAPSGGTARGTSYTKTATASEPKRYKFQDSGRSSWVGGILCFTGGDTAAPFVDTSTFGQLDGDLITSDSLTLTIPNSMMLHHIAYNSNFAASIIKPGDNEVELWNIRILQSDGGTSTRMLGAFAHESFVSAGETGTRTWDPETSSTDEGTLTLLGLSPGLLGSNRILTPIHARLTLTTGKVSVGIGVDITVPAATLIFTGHVPLAQQNLITIPGAALTFTTNKPDVVVPVPVPTAALNFTTYAPKVSVPIQVPSVALNFTTYVPTSYQNLTVFPSASLVLTTYAPDVRVSIEVPAASLILTGYLPTLPDAFITANIAEVLYTAVVFARATSEFSEVLYFSNPEARITTSIAEVLYEVTNARITQNTGEVLYFTSPNARITGNIVEVLYLSDDARITGNIAEVLYAPTPNGRITSTVAEVLYSVNVPARMTRIHGEVLYDSGAFIPPPIIIII